MECVFPIVVGSILLHAEFGPNDHQDDAPRFVLQLVIFLWKGKKENVLLTHGDSITKVSDEFNVISMSSGIVAAIEHKSKSIYGVQFHPEVDLTTNGQQIFSNFIDICGCKRDFTCK